MLPLLLLAAAAAGTSCAQEATSTWQGTFNVAEEGYRAVLQITEENGVHKSVRALYLDFFPETIKVDSSTVGQSRLALATNEGKGRYQAEFSPDGSTLQGTWTWQGQPVNLVLHRVTTEAAWNVPLNYQYHFKDITYARPAPQEPRIPFAPRLAVDYMEQGAIAWTGERQCVACHTNGTYMVVRPLMTPELGAPQQAMRDFWVAELRSALTADPAKRKGDFDATQAVYLAAGLAIWDAKVLHRLSPETAQALKLMFEFQRPAGDWFIEDDNNPPFESSPYQVATVAARAVANAPGWLQQQRGTPIAEHVELLMRYLRTRGKMQGDYDRTDLLWTASEYPGLLDQRQKQELVNMIFAHQQFDGGWSMRTFAAPEQWGKGNRADKLRAELEFPFPQSDGHMTGLAIIALRKAGVPANEPHIQRGIRWLLANQRSSGRWWTRSLNRDGWQFISYSGTAYPLLALSLCNALPSRF
jgi:squalene-hopene/tetraprenyl-beta-curcumene cyclase